MRLDLILVLGLVLFTTQAHAIQTLSQVGDLPGDQQPTISERLVKLEKALSSQAFLEMLQRIDQLQNEGTQLRGEIEEMSHEIQGLKKRQRELYLDLDRRILQLSGDDLSGDDLSGDALSGDALSGDALSGDALSGGNIEGQVDTESETATAIQTGPVNTVIEAKPTKAERAAYQQAYDTLKDGRYQDSIVEFDKFLTKYADGEYADNAQYWMAEAYYVTRKFSKARAGFDKVLADHPQSPKAPDALLKIGFIEYEMAHWPEARRILTDVTKQYPNSGATRLAEKRLLRMRSEKH